MKARGKCPVFLATPLDPDKGGQEPVSLATVHGQRDRTRRPAAWAYGMVLDWRAEIYNDLRFKV